MKKSVSLTIAMASLAIALFFSVPVFAEKEASYTEQISATGAITADMLISGLNAEVDRINANDYWEQVDWLTDSGVEVILRVMYLIDLQAASGEEIDRCVSSHFALIDKVSSYTQTIPTEDINRRIFFESASEYMKNMMMAN